MTCAEKFSKKPVCTASIFYQKRKLEEIKSKGFPEDILKAEVDKVVAKACLCEDLATGALLEYDEDNKRPMRPTVCPGPNLAYFSKVNLKTKFVRQSNVILA